MGWFQRVRKASAGQRVTRADKRQAIDAFAEFSALNADRERLVREGLVGSQRSSASVRMSRPQWLGSWHELELDV